MHDRLSQDLERLAPSVDAAPARALFERRRRIRRYQRWAGRGLVVVLAVGVGAATVVLFSGRDGVQVIENPAVTTETTQQPEPSESVSDQPTSSVPAVGASTPTGPPASGAESATAGQCQTGFGAGEEIRFRPGAISASAAGTLRDGTGDLYRLAASAGQRIAIDVISDGNEAAITLHGPGAVLLADNTATVDLTLVESGEHLICVSPTNGDADYNLTVSITGPVVPQVPPPTDPGGGPIVEASCPDAAAGRFSHTEGTESHTGSIAAGSHELAVIWVVPTQTLTVEVTSTDDAAFFDVRGPGNPNTPSGRLLVATTTRAEIVGDEEGWHAICIGASADTTFEFTVTLSG